MSWDFFWRGVQVAGGTLEVIGGGVMAGVGALGAPVTGGTSLLATVGGAAIGAHGLDQIYAGLTGTPSVASQLGGAAAAAVLGPDYAYIGEFLGDLGPGAAGVWKGVKSLPQLFKNLRSIPGKMKSFIDDLRGAGKLSETLKGLPDEEIAEMLKRGEITDKDLIEAGLDPAKYAGGAKSTKSVPSSGGTSMIDPNDVKFSQNTAGGKGRADALRESMEKNGWDGPPVDAVKTTEGVTTIDNTRVAVAQELGLPEIPVNVHNPGDLLPPSMTGRFGDARTWGEALAHRTGNQRPPLPPTGTGQRPRMPSQKR